MVAPAWEANRKAARLAATGSSSCTLSTALAVSTSAAASTSAGVMAALAREVWAELGASATAQLTIGALPSANSDPALLRQVWINLLSNALKYSARQPSPRIEVAGERSGADLVYRVSDNGAGFDMRYYDKLFRVFQRLHREDEFPGTGVGLAIVQRIITRHGGRVWAEAEVDKGAKFFFALPAPNPL